MPPMHFQLFLVDSSIQLIPYFASMLPFFLTGPHKRTITHGSPQEWTVPMATSSFFVAPAFLSLSFLSGNISCSNPEQKPRAPFPNPEERSSGTLSLTLDFSLPMKWEMEMEEVEAVLERIWDLHDKVSDAIHCISRAHFLHSIKIASPEGKRGPPPFGTAAVPGSDDARNGFVFVKEFKEDDDIAVMAEAKSLNAIRTALENLEDQLEFFHTVQSQQRAERDAAIARLEQSRIILAMRLADHQGKKYKVIEEALDFVGDVHDTGRFIAPENLYEMPRSQENSEDLDEKSPNIMMRMFISSLQLMKNSLKLERIGGVLGNAALLAVSMLALLQLHRVALESDTSQVQQEAFVREKNDKNVFQTESSQRVYLKHLDVFSARG